MDGLTLFGSDDLIDDAWEGGPERGTLVIVSCLLLATAGMLLVWLGGER